MQAEFAGATGRILFIASIWILCCLFSLSHFVVVVVVVVVRIPTF